MTDLSVIRTHGATQALTHADSYRNFIEARIAYQRTRAATTEFVAERDNALAHVARYQDLARRIGGAA